MKNNQLMMDLYELTMANGYFLDGYERDKWVIFDVFYRKNPDNGGYAIFAGLEQIVDYLRQGPSDSEADAKIKTLIKKSEYKRNMPLVLVPEV